MIELSGQAEGFVGPNMRQRLQPLRRQELQRRNPAEISPVVAVGGPGEAGVVVTEISAVEEIGPVREDDVILLGQAFLRERWRRDEENGPGAQAEEEGRPVSPRHVGEAPVEGPLEEVDVADQGEGRKRAGREVSQFAEDVDGYAIQGC